MRYRNITARDVSLRGLSGRRDWSLLPRAEGVNATVVPIERVSADVYVVPTDGAESDGTLDWSSTTVVVAQADAADETGLGWPYASEGGAVVIRDELGPVVVGLDATDIPAASARMNRAVRNIGRPGIAGCAIAAVETALWDLKAKLFDTSVVRLMGRVVEAVPAYGSGGFCNYSSGRLAGQLRDWAAAGLGMVKMKVGRDPSEDIARVAVARDAIGDATQLFVDANGAYTRKQAAALANAFAELGVTWFEEPVSSDDVVGLRLLRVRAPSGLEIAAGEYGWTAFAARRLLDAQAVDVSQIDATRCGGFTGYRNAVALATAACVPVSAHTSPTLHAHVACCAPTRHVEYSGTIATWAARHWVIRAGREFYLSGNLATMAPGLPYANAVQWAHPGPQVIAFVGDGGFAMLMAEFNTACRYGLPIKVIVNNNSLLGQILWEQIALGFPEFGVRWNRSFDFKPWADACGGAGYTVEDPADIHDAVAAAFATDGPALIDVRTNGEEPPMPAKIRYDQAKGFVEAFLHGQPHRMTIASTLFRDKVDQLVGSKDR